MQPKDTIPWPQSARRFKEILSKILRDHKSLLVIERAKPPFSTIRAQLVLEAQALLPRKVNVVELWLITFLNMPIITPQGEKLMPLHFIDLAQEFRKQIEDDPEAFTTIVQLFEASTRDVGLNPLDRSAIYIVGILLLSEPMVKSAEDFKYHPMPFGLATLDGGARQSTLRIAKWGRGGTASEGGRFLHQFHTQFAPEPEIETRHGHETRAGRRRREAIKKLGWKEAYKRYVFQKVKVAVLKIDSTLKDEFYDVPDDIDAFISIANWTPEIEKAARGVLNKAKDRWRKQFPET